MHTELLKNWEALGLLIQSLVELDRDGHRKGYYDGIIGAYFSVNHRDSVKTAIEKFRGDPVVKERLMAAFDCVD